jgi:hypothetical protein
MFEDVRHPSVIGRIRLEPDGEDIVRVISGDVEVVRPGLVVFELEGCQLQLGDLLHALESEAMDLLSDFRIAREIGDSSKSTSRRDSGAQAMNGPWRPKLPLSGAQHVGGEEQPLTTAGKKSIASASNFAPKELSSALLSTIRRPRASMYHSQRPVAYGFWLM